MPRSAICCCTNGTNFDDILANAKSVLKAVGQVADGAQVPALKTATELLLGIIEQVEV